ncbi:MAG: hypothetical protein ACT4P5_01065 [Armatimonadota bacterium]
MFEWLCGLWTSFSGWPRAHQAGTVAVIAAAVVLLLGGTIHEAQEAMLSVATTTVLIAAINKEP